jgi:hypothetical protein
MGEIKNGEVAVVVGSKYGVVGQLQNELNFA